MGLQEVGGLGAALLRRGEAWITALGRKGLKKASRGAADTPQEPLALLPACPDTLKSPNDASTGPPL